MATFSAIEVSSTIKRNNHKLQIRISDTIGENAEAKMQEIRSILDQAIAEFQNEEETVEEAENTASGPTPASSDLASDLVTTRQVRLIKKLLREKKIPEKDFCDLQGISCLEELNKSKGRWVIGAMLYS